MNKDDILKEFDTLAEAKRKGAVNLKLCLGFALLVVCIMKDRNWVKSGGM